jgi:hypothetical protein
MRVGLKSLLVGAHCFALHPFFVAWGWSKCYRSRETVEFWTPAGKGG